MLDEDFLRKEVEPHIDRLYLRKPLIGRSRDSAVIHLLRVFEDASRLLKMRSLSSPNQELQFHTRMRWAHEAIPWALRWVWRDCPTRDKSNLELDWTIYKEARDLMNLAFDYYHVCRFFVLYSRGFIGAATTKDRKRVRFYFRSDIERDQDVASIVYDVLQDFTPLRPKSRTSSRESIIIINTLLPVYIRKVTEFSIAIIRLHT
jgi:hypothetical protein